MSESPMSVEATHRDVYDRLRWSILEAATNAVSPDAAVARVDDAVRRAQETVRSSTTTADMICTATTRIISAGGEPVARAARLLALSVHDVQDVPVRACIRQGTIEWLQRVVASGNLQVLGRFVQAVDGVAFESAFTGGYVPAPFLIDREKYPGSHMLATAYTATDSGASMSFVGSANGLPRPESLVAAIALEKDGDGGTARLAERSQNAAGPQDDVFFVPRWIKGLTDDPNAPSAALDSTIEPYVQLATSSSGDSQRFEMDLARSGARVTFEVRVRGSFLSVQWWTKPRLNCGWRLEILNPATGDKICPAVTFGRGDDVYGARFYEKDLGGSPSEVAASFRLVPIW